MVEMTYLLDQIHNWRTCNAGIPAGYELEAVVDAVISGWGDYSCIEATAEKGVADADSRWIAEIIEEHGLSVTQEQAEAELLKTCRERVAN